MKIKNIIKKNIFGFILTAIVFGSITFVMATNIDSTTAAYITTENTDVGNIADALDDLYLHSASVVNNNPIVCYNGTCGTLSYRYWNDGFSTTTYQSNSLPTTTYATRALLAQNYSNFAIRPYYIRSILIDGNVVGHQACTWYNNNEFCFSPGYWIGTIGITDANAGTQTEIKLQRDMQIALGLQSTDVICDSSDNHVRCDIGGYKYFAYSNGLVSSGGPDSYCDIYGNGTAYCL